MMNCFLFSKEPTPWVLKKPCQKGKHEDASHIPIQKSFQPKDDAEECKAHANQ
jgi:hypothetical protein